MNPVSTQRMTEPQRRDMIVRWNEYRRTHHHHTVEFDPDHETYIDPDTRTEQLVENIMRCFTTTKGTNDATRH